MNTIRLRGGHALVALAVFFGLAFGWVVAALAQVATGGDPVPAAPPPDLAEIIKQAINIFNDWKTGGVIVGLLAVTNVLTNASKLPWLVEKVPAAARSWIALGLAVLAAFLGALASGAGWPAAIAAGITAGLASIGFHELVQSLSKNKRDERAAGAALAAAVKTADSAGVAKMDALNAAIVEILSTEDEKERLAKLAEWVKSHPPA